MSDIVYHFFSGKAYKIGKLDKDNNREIFIDKELEVDGGRLYSILNFEDNKTNGMQAMTVAPIIDGKVDK